MFAFSPGRLDLRDALGFGAAVFAALLRRSRLIMLLSQS
jgi:hypothetical protein